MYALVETALSLGRRVAAALRQALPLVTRLVVGQAFMLSGWGKLHNLDGVTKFFTDLGIPMPGANALFIANLEFIGGIALVLGLGTRVFAALLSSTMVVAMLTADKEEFLKSFALWPDKGLVDLTPFAYLLFLLWLVAHGPGAIAIDRIIAWAWCRRCAGEPKAAPSSAP
jgi:putative oxidoreductase